jgi:hypothetical protein
MWGGKDGDAGVEGGVKWTEEREPWIVLANVYFL